MLSTKLLLPQVEHSSISWFNYSNNHLLYFFAKPVIAGVCLGLVKKEANNIFGACLSNQVNWIDP